MKDDTCQCGEQLTDDNRPEHISCWFDVLSLDQFMKLVMKYRRFACIGCGETYTFNEMRELEDLWAHPDYDDLDADEVRQCGGCTGTICVWYGKPENWPLDASDVSALHKRRAVKMTGQPSPYARHAVTSKKST